jgi:hypothetical protein
MNRGRLAKYSLWQFRDLIIDRGIAILIIGFLWGYVTFEPMRSRIEGAYRGHAGVRRFFVRDPFGRLVNILTHV